MNTPNNDIDQKLIDNKEKLIPALGKFHGKTPDDVKYRFDDLVSMTKPLAELQLKEVTELLALLQEKEQLEEEQKSSQKGSEHYI